MFNKQKDSEEEMPAAAAATVAEDANQTAVIDDDAEIHTMPSKFLNPMNLPKKRGKISWLILGVLAFVVLGGVIAVAVIYLGGQAEPSPTALINQAPAINLNQTAANENNNVNSASNQNQNVNQGLSASAERDAKRLQGVADIRTALSLYFSSRHVYPNMLEVLLDEFLTNLPQNPEPGGQSYLYQATADQTNYQLAFQLESGGTIGSVKLKSGNYVAVSDNIMTQADFMANSGNNNQNQNINTNVNQQPPAQQLTLGLDSDGDQLTDIEENIFQTNSALADTDGDGYTDASEILNFYDPTKSGGRLMDSGLISVYQNSVYNYSLLYPKTWVARSLTADNKEVIFTSSTGEFIEIIIQDNPLTLSAYNWYINQNPGVDTAKISSLIIDGLPAIQSPDGLTTFLAAGTKIYSTTYNIGTGNQMNFYTSYQLFLKSFMFIEPVSANNQ